MPADHRPVPHVVPVFCLIRDWGDDSEDEQVQQNAADDSEVGVVWLCNALRTAVGGFQGLMTSVSELTKYRRRTAIRRLTQAPSREATTRVRREPHGQAATAETKRTRTRLVAALPRLSLRPSHCPRKSCTWEMGRAREIDTSRAMILVATLMVEGFGRVSLSGALRLVFRMELKKKELDDLEALLAEMGVKQEGGDAQAAATDGKSG